MNSRIKITPVRRALSQKEKREAEKQRKHLDGSPILFLLYLGGLISMLYVFVESEFLSMGVFVVASVFISLLSAALWFVYFYQSKYFVYLVIGFCILALLLGAWQIPQMARTFSSYFKGGGFNVSFGMLALLVLAAVFVLFAIEFVLRRHAVLFLLAGAEVIAGPLIELRAGFVTIILIILFQFAFMVLNMTKTSPRKEFVSKNRASVSNASAVLIAVLLLISFIPAIIIQKIYEEQLFLGVYQTDAVIKDITDKITGNSSGSDINGNVSRGNLRQTGATVFELKTTELPDEKMYFRTFTGTTYIGDYWDYSNQMFLKPTAGDSLLVGQPNEQKQKNYRYGTDEEENEDDNRDEDEEEYYNEHSDDEYIYTDQLTYDVISRVISNYKMAVYDLMMLYLQNVTDDMSFAISGNEGQITVDLYNKYGELILWGSVSTLTNFTVDSSLGNGAGKVYNGDYLWVALQINDVSNIKSGTDDAVMDRYYSSTYFRPSEVGLARARRYLRDEPSPSEYVPVEGIASLENDGLTRYYIYDLEKNPGLKRIKNYPSLLTSGNPSDISNDIVYELSMDKAQPNGMIITPDDYSGLPSVPYFCESSQGTLIMKNQFIYDENGIFSYRDAFLTAKDITAKDKWEDNPNYHDAMNIYKEESQYVYTHTNSYVLPRLTEYCQGREFKGDLNTVTTFILYTLQNNAEYSPNPGSTPWNKDPAEYFLFDNHKGFCVHYATVAANMYRMLGIPCRYVAGYCVDPLFMHETDKNEKYYKYQINVTDYTAHAWVEIFLEDYGWVPVEVTPDENNMMHTTYPGYDEDVMNRIMKEHGWSFSESKNSGGAGQGGGGIGGLGGIGGFNGFNAPVLLILIAVMMAAAVIVLLIRRAVIMGQTSREGCGRAFDRIIRALHYSGLLTGQNGSEPDFDAALSGCVDCISPERAKEILDIMQKHSFSETQAQEDEIQAVRAASAEITRELYEKLPWRKKLVYKYWKALI